MCLSYFMNSKKIDHKICLEGRFTKITGQRFALAHQMMILKTMIKIKKSQGPFFKL